MGNKCSFSLNTKSKNSNDLIDLSGISVPNINTDIPITTTTLFQSNELLLTKDSIVNTIISKFVERSNLGFQKYGTTLDRNDLTIVEWTNHMQEELMDAILYLEKLKTEINNKLKEINQEIPENINKVLNTQKIGVKWDDGKLLSNITKIKYDNIIKPDDNFLKTIENESNNTSNYSLKDCDKPFANLDDSKSILKQKSNENNLIILENEPIPPVIENTTKKWDSYI